MQKASQILISKKIANWEGLQAEKLNKLPREEREKGWKRLKRNLGGKEADRRVILRSEGRDWG